MITYISLFEEDSDETIPQPGEEDFVGPMDPYAAGSPKYTEVYTKDNVYKLADDPEEQNYILKKLEDNPTAKFDPNPHNFFGSKRLSSEQIEQRNEAQRQHLDPNYWKVEDGVAVPNKEIAKLVQDNQRRLADLHNRQANQTAQTVNKYSDTGISWGTGLKAAGLVGAGAMAGVLANKYKNNFNQLQRPVQALPPARIQQNQYN